MKKILIITVLLFGASAQAQELNCNVQVNSQQVQSTNKQTFNALQQKITNFVNNRRWTEMSFTTAERIECNMSIVVKSVESDVFTAEIVVQSRRPVYRTSYSTPLLNVRDQNFTFDFKEFDQLEIVNNALTSNLTAVLAYYCYLIIGYDLDSYSPMGGTPCFRQAETIVTMAQSSDWGGWKAFENDRNRYAVISNLMDEQFAAFRSYLYDYHRLGLDIMSENAINGRAKIAAGLPIVRTLNRSRPQTAVINMFLDAKTDELINIFKGGTDKEKETTVEILTDLNPTLSNRYETIMDKK